MNGIKVVSGVLVATLISGCATMNGASGPRGPRLVGSSRATNGNGYYAEVGMEFSSPVDFFAMLAPSRWRSPIKAGGSLSWVNPRAWSEDPGRTGRILMGEVVVIGGVVVAAVSAGGDGGSSSDSPEGPMRPAGPGEVPNGGAAPVIN